jgi:hypothetical protein
METTKPNTYTIQSELLQEMNKEQGLDDCLESKLFCSLLYNTRISN